MRFLSVAERELRAAARQRRTHRLRWLTAAAFFGLLVWLMWTFNSFRAPQVFGIFLVITFFYCLIIGTARSADCLSSERREGTLGLLFLTNLNGPEIIAGKLCSSALAAAYGLFAIFPLLALQMLIGGISLVQFWKSVLALMNVILFSISAGFLASSICTRQFTAVATATGLALFFSVGLLAIAALVDALRAKWASGVAIFSPLYTLLSAEGRVFGRNYYWPSAAVVHAMSWIWLAVATWRTSVSWRDRPRKTAAWKELRFLEKWRERGRARRAALRRRLLQVNPFLWLSGPRPVSAPIFMVLAVLLVSTTSYFAGPLFGRVMRAGTFSPLIGHLFAWFWTALIAHAVLLYYAAMTASRRLAEDKQTGALELVLSTPTSERAISRGLWLAYGRRLFFPILFVVLVHAFFIWQGATLAALDPEAPEVPAGTTPGQLLWHAFLNRPLNGVRIEWFMIFALRLLLLALTLLGLVWITLGAIGPWLGLRMKYPGFAPMLSLALVFIPPVLLFSFVCFLADQFNLDRLPGRLFAPLLMWIAFGIGAGHCLLLFLWAKHRLRKDFRTTVTSYFQPPPLRPWWRPTRRLVVRFAVVMVALAAGLVLVVVGFYSYQNWQSRRAWAGFQKQLRQSKKPTELAALMPGPVPAAQNFALSSAFRSWADASLRATNTTRLFEQLQPFEVKKGHSGVTNAGIDWPQRQFLPLHLYLELSPSWPAGSTHIDVAQAWLKELDPHQELMGALAAAARLPFFQSYTNQDAAAVLNPPVEDTAALERLHGLFQLHACALLAVGRGDEAAAALTTALELVRLARQTPDVQGFTRIQVMLVRCLQPLWEGMVEARWKASQLSAFQEELLRINLLIDYTNAVGRATLANIEIWQQLAEGKPTTMMENPPGQVWQLQPRGWWLQNCLDLYQSVEKMIGQIDIAGGHLAFGMAWVDLHDLPVDWQTSFLFQQQYYWSLSYPGSVIFTQTALNQAIIACALERHRLEHGSYPETLHALVPGYLRAIPHDIVVGKPMVYETAADRGFVLRSLGPNQVNDRTNKISDDWLWSFPTNAAPPAATQ